VIKYKERFKGGGIQTLIKFRSQKMVDFARFSRWLIALLINLLKNPVKSSHFLGSKFDAISHPDPMALNLSQNSLAQSTIV